MVEILENLKKEIEKTQVVILAGGSAKRMGKIDKPKALLELREGWTLLDNELDFFAKCGFKNFVLVLGHMHEQIEEHVEKMGYKKRFNIEISVDPTTENWGKGKALKYALDQGKIKKERFIISFPDDLKFDSLLPLKLFLQHLSFVNKYGSLGTITLVNGIEFPFGVAKLNGEGKVISFVEKPLVNTLTNIGLYMFEKDVLDLIREEIEITLPKPIEFEDVIIPRLASQGKLYSLVVPPDVWLPINDMKSYEKALKIFRSEKREASNLSSI
jgi:NDP-sugar pyrophosphorylase family protein